MRLTDDQIRLIRASFRQVLPVSGLAAELFYARLFIIAPEVQGLFGHDMAEQGRKLMRMLAAVVEALDDLDGVLDTARDLGSRHVAFGVTPAHYAPVGEALLYTLERCLDGRFPPELRAAWARLYALLAGEMARGACPEVAPAAQVAAE